MTREDITRMAREAGFVGFDGENKCLRKFADLVAAAERQACADLVDANAMACENPIHRSLLQANAAAIRDRDPRNMPLFDDWGNIPYDPTNNP